MTHKTTKLDTFYQVETPEGINLLFRPASPVIRSLALLIDILMQLLIITISFLGMTILIALVKKPDYLIGTLLILSFLVFWWYFVLFEVLNNGQSLGKRFCNIRVIHDDGTPIGWSASLLRNLLRAIDILPSFSYAVGLITGITNKEFKRLGDFAAGTLVVYNDDKTNFQPLPEVTPIASPFPLSLQEQQLILAFAERRTTLSAERRLEIAAILSPHFNLDPQQTEQKLYQIAQYIMGSQGDTRSKP